VTILLDKTDENIYPNMAVSAMIITDIKTDVITIPTTSLTTTGNSTTVQVMKNGKVTTVTVKIGSANDTDTEITSGLNVGDEVVTEVIDTSTTSQTQTTSAFSSSTTKSSSTKSSSSNIGGGMMGGPPGM
jgi:trimeric autotransporter adhesin